MSARKIQSPANEYLKKVAKLKQKKFRDTFRLFVTEGERSCREAANSGFFIESVIMTEDFYENHGHAFADFDCIVTPDSVFKTLSDTETPQGILAVAVIPEQKALLGGRYVYCDCIQDPGNAGTIIRSADAFGFDGVIFSRGSVDVYSPKVIRSSMGSVFHVAIVTGAELPFLKQAQQDGFFITCSALYGTSIDSWHMQKGTKQMIVVGNEGSGVSESILELADEIVHIPMQGSAESLNAAVAASVLMYEVSRNE